MFGLRSLIPQPLLSLNHNNKYSHVFLMEESGSSAVINVKILNITGFRLKQIMTNETIVLATTTLSIGLAAKLLLENQVKPKPVTIPVPVKNNQKQ